ncbi:MAG: mandelate racemase/muconate lactonizing enzyme family protein [SAR324 cluster bacterium]|nr:mandelate racemase/muconate lactonizing enzyme family protein [SAR324 cluster bacterium]MCZ6557196.1 mandelate racemase/muconate lactonizing enzyme family protein [SAR324 cluster bacterium]MCZ6627444.1 mandelate racemase/muconate lactonizing enzyme family protein [SAR324 cluster bacterium]MCZ6647025.1 mandelate racemase/muconate lactonizing enzyme family protein [SAR324 cluster bacterium]MCZ6842876.1 mandelate racemase/muconate lactonizing enzyme family protein [SAR324 cluster bacterium]
MIIKDLRIHTLSIPWIEQPVYSPHAARGDRTVLVVELETASGLVGQGFIQPLRGGMRSIAACLEEMIKPLVMGEDATYVEKLWQKMYYTSYWQGRMGIALNALSLVDIALWDLVGKHAGLPLYKLWGAHCEDLPIYGSGCFRGLGGDGMIEKAKRYVAQGYKAIKMQVAHLHTLAEDHDHVRRMREALGPEIDIMIDVNMGWTADLAILMGRKFEQYDIYWLEEPVHAEDFAGYQRVAQALDLRIVGGESHYTRFDLRPFFENPCLPILQPDVMRGGLTELRKIATVADTWGVRIAPHLYHELMTHVNASIPNAEVLEYMGFMDDLWVKPVNPENGMVRPPQEPGHGLAIKPELIKDHQVKD